MHHVTWQVIVVVGAIVLGVGTAAGQPGRSTGQQADYRAAVLDKYCVTCHNARAKIGGLVLEDIDIDRPETRTDVWEKVIRKVRGGVMPPMTAARPDGALLADFVSYLERSLDAASAAAPNPGRPLVHRLNRAEYTNAVRDLLSVEIDGRALLPGDDASYGFDNVADVLSVSPTLLDRYLLVSKKISRVAVGDPTMRPVTDTFTLPDALLQADRMSEDLPFGTRGGLSFRYTFPVDGEYEIRLKLQRSSINAFYSVRGLDLENVLYVLVDGQLAREFPIRPVDTDQGFLQRGDPEGYGVESKLHVRVPVKAGIRRIGVAMLRGQWYVEGVGVERLPLASDAYIFPFRSGEQVGKIELAINGVDITGPFNVPAAPPDSPSRRRIFVCRPATPDEEAPCATTILSGLAQRAYRRPVTSADVSRLMEFYEIGRQDGSFDQGIQAAIERLLVSPYFLLRKEQDPPDLAPSSAYTISDVELASRLSFFLWSSIPDEELLRLAEQQRLSDPVVLQEQVARMLRDPRAKALVTNFFGQWLYLRNMASVQPNVKIFPEFDESLREAFMRETELFIESQLQEDSSALDLLTANYTFVNERLAKHYGIPHVYGSHFRRVTLPEGPRAGLLGHGSVLTVTSYADRTSPVVRGKWLLENLLGSPPPPPPPEVPPFPANKSGETPQSVRARMELHRRNPACASCHNVIDPLGFAMENFDAIGRYRTMDGETVIDPSGTLPDGAKFTGPSEFREALLRRREELMRSLTEKFLIYALGRGLESYDMPAIRQITREAAAGGDRWSSLIVSLVRSTPFQMRRSES